MYVQHCTAECSFRNIVEIFPYSPLTCQIFRGYADTEIGWAAKGTYRALGSPCLANAARHEAPHGCLTNYEIKIATFTSTLTWS